METQAKGVMVKSEKIVKSKKMDFWHRLGRDLLTHKYLYLMVIPMVVWYLVFCYVPMYGVLMAFQNYNPRMGITGSEWIGFAHFTSFFQSNYFVRLIRNTLLISIYDLLWGFPAPILFALLLNELRGKWFKKTVQTVSYIPYFISLMVICGLLKSFCSSGGLFNDIRELIGLSRVDLLARPELFRTLYVSSGIWQNIGFNSIIYIAALTNIDQGLYEAATIDGAGKFKQVFHITLPGILPTIMILLILRVGSLMSVGYEKIILLYSSVTYETADVISTFVYRKGILDANYSYSAAIGLFNSVINFILLIGTNWLSRRTTENSLW